VEVLVAMALLSFALYALVAAHAAALRYSQMSQHRATAVLLAADLGERLRANLGGVGEVEGEAPVEVEGVEDGTGPAPPIAATGFWAGDYDYTLDFQRQQGAVVGPAESCADVASRCTAAQMAAVDLAQWRQAVRRQLPEGAVYTQRDAVRAVMDLWVAWRESARVASDASDAVDLAPVPPGECAEGLGVDQEGGIRCVHLRIGL
jgi:type IV pilus assembly protein PilV